MASRARQINREILPFTYLRNVSDLHNPFLSRVPLWERHPGMGPALQVKQKEVIQIKPFGQGFSRRAPHVLALVFTSFQT